MTLDTRFPMDRLTELRDEVLETLRGAVPGSEGGRALLAQLGWIDEQIAAERPRPFRPAHSRSSLGPAR
jgi:hypothetical protein